MNQNEQHPLGLWYKLFARVSCYTHESHLLPISPALLLKLKEIPGFMPRLHLHLSRYWQDQKPALCTYAPVELDPIFSKLIFLEPKKFHKLVMLLGALDLGPILRATISKAQVEVLQESLGQDIMHFVCTRHGGFYSGRLVSSEVLSIQDTVRRVSVLGYAMLFQVRDALPEYLQECWLLRLPAECRTDLLGDMTATWLKNLIVTLYPVFSL